MAPWPRRRASTPSQVSRLSSGLQLGLRGLQLLVSTPLPQAALSRSHFQETRCAAGFRERLPPRWKPLDGRTRPGGGAPEPTPDREWEPASPVTFLRSGKHMLGGRRAPLGPDRHGSGLRPPLTSCVTLGKFLTSQPISALKKISSTLQSLCRIDE
uniref:Uncharacterized protein n=1 Tax=Rousettus aegyptiacus TaxID=9407 RepID=A0A7J8FIK5_ROUAE|nr:hypothetical protein HJG63_011881 [Rousettus aegyptiacus]